MLHPSPSYQLLPSATLPVSRLVDFSTYLHVNNPISKMSDRENHRESSTMSPSSARSASHQSSTPSVPTSVNPNAMTMTQFVPNSSLYHDLKLQLGDDQDDAQTPWELDANDGIPFISGSQLSGQKDAAISDVLTSTNEANSSVTNAGTLSSSRPTNAHIPSHIVKNNPFLNKLRRYVWSESFRVSDTPFC